MNRERLLELLDVALSGCPALGDDARDMARLIEALIAPKTVPECEAEIREAGGFIARAGVKESGINIAGIYFYGERGETTKAAVIHKRITALLEGNG